MDEKEVVDLVNAHLRAALLDDYPALKSNTAIDRASRLFTAGTPITMITPLRSHEDWPAGTRWELLVEFSAALQADTNKTAFQAIEGDRDMRAKLQNAVRLEEGYKALRDAGLLMATIDALPEDQRGEDTINPHVFRCLTT